MEWLQRMEDSLDYLEHHMELPLNVNETARVACSSPYHFQRMFHMVTGVTLGEYVRKRKLTLAAQELASSNIKVLDVALKYGYDTPESFAKAFRRVHGFSPSAAREPGKILKAYPRLSFHISLKGDQEVDYQIIEKEAFPVIGKKIQVSTKDGENFRRIPAFWAECYKNGTTEKICSLAEKNEFLGICMDYYAAKEKMSYMIAVESDRKDHGGLDVKTIPAATWAIFQSVGSMPGAIQRVWERIYSE